MSDDRSLGILIVLRRIAAGFAIVAVLAMLLALWAAHDTDRVAVSVTPPTTKTARFNPSRPPTDMSAGEAALTSSKHQCEALVGTMEVAREQTGDGDVRLTARVDQVKLNLGLAITIWLPPDAPEFLVEHEEAHARISRIRYEHAAAVARKLGEQFIGHEVTVTAPSAEEAATRAGQQAAEELTRRYERTIPLWTSATQDHFDRLTDHGRNGVSPERAADESLTDVPPPEGMPDLNAEP